jgi:hypothetical protein
MALGMANSKLGLADGKLGDLANKGKAVYSDAKDAADSVKESV